MTEPRIDRFARSLAHGLSRRRLLGGLGGSALAAGGLLATSKSALVCQRAGTTCDPRQRCCQGATCQGGVCICVAGSEQCDGDGRCVNFQSDQNHCGRCGGACAVGETCCAGLCVEAERDRANCGTCGNVCSENELCVLGSCLACPLGTLPCRTTCRPRGRCGAEQRPRRAPT